MTAAVVHIGPRRAPEQVAYDLVWEVGQGRADDWRRDEGLTARLAEALAAEQPEGGRWVGYDEEVVAQ